MEPFFVSLFMVIFWLIWILVIVPMGGDREVTIQMHCLNMYY